MHDRPAGSQTFIRRPALRFLVALAGVGMAVLLLIEVLARCCWTLSGAGKPLPVATAVAASPSIDAVAYHRVEEWPVARGRVFHQAPMLDAPVKSGTLPPVASRLPEDPQVIVPPQQIGPYGGAWRRFGTELADIQPYIAHRLPYGNLLRWGPKADRLLPNLAVKWQMSADNRACTVWLRRGVRWSDGVLFTVDDILFYFQDVLQNEELTPSIGREYKPGGEVMQVERLDLYTVRFVFAAPYGRFVHLLAGMPGIDMIDCAAHYLKQFHPRYVPMEQLTARAREEGYDDWVKLFNNARDFKNPAMPRLWPWIVTQPPPARPIVLERNPYYWKVDPRGNQLPYIDRVTFELFDPETINMKAMNGEVGMQDRHIRFENYPLLMKHRAQGHYRVLRWVDSNGGTNILGLNLNHKDPVKAKLLGDRRFRIALSYAIDRESINQACFFGMGVPRQVAPPPTSLFAARDYANAYTAYNPAEANRLLDVCGLTRRNFEGFRLRPDNNQPLTLTIDANQMACNPGALQLVADDWTRVGIRTDVRLLARQLFYQRKDALMHDVGVWYGADEQLPTLDPRWFFPWSKESIQGVGYAAWFRSNGKKGIAPPTEIAQCMALYRRLECTADLREHQRIFRQIIDLNKHNLWVIGTIGQVPVLYVVQDSFRNVPDVAINGWQFRGPGNTAPECYAIEEGKR